MMKYPIKTVHGHALSELEGFLEGSCEIFDKPVTLERNSIGGWSNINLRGQSSGIEFVLKLPWSTQIFDSNPYDQMYNLSLTFSRLDIAAPPLIVGRLPNSSETPFYLVEYIDGATHSAIEDVSNEELLSLKESLHLLKEQKLDGVPVYESPMNLLSVNHERVENHEWLPKASTETRLLIEQYLLLLPSVESMIAMMGYWSRDTIHGDLWIPNLVFRPNKKTLFLDFESCAIADSRYDLAYFLEVHETGPIKNFPSFIMNEDIDFINSLRPLVLAYVIDWCIERLLSMESGVVEQNLNTPKIFSMILGYCYEKIVRLESILH